MVTTPFLVRAALALCTAVSVSSASAADRPYLLSSSAVAEEDDDAVWSLETWGQRIGSERSFSVATEYAFDPLSSVQLEATRSSGRRDEVELEFKRLFNHIARDGWGWGLVAAVTAAKAPDLSWRTEQWSLVMPFSLRLGDGSAMLHANLGLIKPREDARLWLRTIVGETEVARNLKAFLEVGRRGDEQVAHGGVRYWAKREKLALDLSYQHVRRDGTRDRGWIVGLGWYDW